MYFVFRSFFLNERIMKILNFWKKHENLIGLYPSKTYTYVDLPIVPRLCLSHSRTLSNLTYSPSKCILCSHFSSSCVWDSTSAATSGHVIISERIIIKIKKNHECLIGLHPLQNLYIYLPIVPRRILSPSRTLSNLIHS